MTEKQVITFNNIIFTHTVSDKKNYFDNHCHNEFEFILILQGNPLVTIESNQYRIDKPCLIGITPGLYHSVKKDGSNDYERITVLVKAADITKEIYAELLGGIKNKPIMHSNDIIQTMKKMQSCILNTNQKMLLPYLNSLFVELCYLIIFESQTILPVATDNKITDIIDYINDNIEKILTVSDIAEALHFSESTIKHSFKKFMNISIKQYILKKRMAYAASLLSSNVPAKQVAAQLNYTNYSNFYTIYKKITGQTPSQTIENNKG